MSRRSRGRKRRTSQDQQDLLGTESETGEAMSGEPEVNAASEGEDVPAGAHPAGSDTAGAEVPEIRPAGVSLLEMVGPLVDEVARLEAGNDAPQALTLVREARATSPGISGLLVLEIHLLGLLGRFIETEEPLRTLRLAEGDTMEVARTAGILAFRMGRHEEAEAELRRALEKGDVSGDSHYYLGETLNRTGRVAEALEIMAQGVELNDADPRAYKTLGRLLDREGRTNEAALMYRKAREIEG